MALGTNRDYKTRDRSARNALRWHYQRMLELQAQGLSRLQASEQAYDELKELNRLNRRKHA